MDHWIGLILVSAGWLCAGWELHAHVQRRRLRREAEADLAAADAIITAVLERRRVDTEFERMTSRYEEES